MTRTAKVGMPSPGEPAGGNAQQWEGLNGPLSELRFRRAQRAFQVLTLRTPADPG